MATGRIVLLVIVVGTIVRLWLAGITGLGYDESYMVGNARVFALSYLDHPPLHVWIAGLAERLFASEAPIVVRLPFVLLFAGSVWLMYRLTARLFGERAGLWAVIAFNLAPVFTLSHASWVLPDGPAIFFLLATANVVARILFDPLPLRSPPLWWLAAGVLAGFALLSKFNTVFLIAAVFVTLLTVPTARRQLATVGPWLAVLAVAVVFLPVVLWNLDHGMVGFLFQARRVGAPAVHPGFLAQDIGGELLYLTPWLAIPFFISLVRALGTGTRDQRAWFMALAAVGPIAVFTCLALFQRGLPHWTMPGWLFAIPLFGRDAAELALRRPRFAQGYMAAVAAIFVVLLAAFLVQFEFGALIPKTLVADNPAIDPTVDLIDWTALRTALGERGLLPPGAAVASPHWLYAGKTSYALGPEVPVVCICSEPQQFAFRGDQQQWAGRDLVVVVPSNASRLWSNAAQYFDTLEPLSAVAITRNGATVMTLELSLGKNLHFPQK
jgi:4-amino-4-deoxy-L-arabinose transferase-like glycosyltransferase